MTRDVWRTGVGPRKADRGLRGLGLLVIIFAFLIASNRFVSGDNKDTTPSTPAGPTVVVADQALGAILREIDKTPRLVLRPGPGTAPAGSTPTGASTPRTSTPTSPTATTPSSSAAPTATDRSVATADVVVSADGNFLDRLVAAKGCAPAVIVATDPSTKPALVYRACAVFHGGAVRPRAQTYIGTLVGLAGRVGFLDAGFDLPPRTS